MTYLMVTYLSNWIGVEIFSVSELTELLLLMDKFGDLGVLYNFFHVHVYSTLFFTISITTEISDRARFYLQLLFTLSAERVRTVHEQHVVFK